MVLHFVNAVFVNEIAYIGLVLMLLNDFAGLLQSAYLRGSLEEAR